MQNTTRRSRRAAGIAAIAGAVLAALALAGCESIGDTIGHEGGCANTLWDHDAYGKEIPPYRDPPRR